MTLNEVESLIKTIKTPKDLFGIDPINRHRELQRYTHPDKNPKNKEQAEKLFAKINQLWEDRNTPSPVIKSSKRAYQLDYLIKSGDVADIYHASSDSKNYIFKISRIEGGFRLLDNEREVLIHLLTESKASVYSRMIPTLSESFLAKDKIQKRINVFVAEPGLYSFETVHEQHNALDGRHLAWIFKRLLMALGFVHRKGYIHGAILPSHLLLHAENHGLQLIGWGHSVKNNNVIKTISNKYREWYAPEILAKKPVTPATDIYMAARSMIFLAGGDPISYRMPDSVPSDMKRFFKSCVLEGQTMRSEDAWKLHDEFNELVVAIYGPPKYHVLSMK